MVAVENENGSVFLAHRLKRALYLDGARGARGRIFRPDGIARTFPGFFQRLRDVALALAEHVERGVDRDAVDPGGKLRVASERAQCA